MEQKTFTTNPGNALNKIAELRKEGWDVIATANTSTPSTEPDAHGVSYGGPEFSILAERKQKFSNHNFNVPRNPSSLYGR